MLVKDAGYTLRDIRGTRSRVIRREERTDLISRIRRYFNFLDDPEPKVVIEERNEPGMMEDEVLRRLVYHDEIEEIREEEQEDKMREIRRKQKNMGYSKGSASTTTATGAGGRYG